jgi:hypothetical protein
MKLVIIVFLLTYKCYGQNAINYVSIDTSGLLKWSISFIDTQNQEFYIQKKAAKNWYTISKLDIRMVLEVFLPEPKTVTCIDSCLVPIDKGENSYRIIMASPIMLESKEAITNTKTPKNIKILYEKENYIYLENRSGFNIYDEFGKEVRKPDYGRMINVTGLKKGLYYINVSGRDIYLFYKK